MKTKFCGYCKSEKPVNEFGKDSKSKDGLCYWCRKCRYKYEVRTPKAHAESRIRHALYRKRLKNETFAAYGGYKCCICGEVDETVLQLDHINNDGNIHRASINKYKQSGYAVYLNLRKRGFPIGMQVLCANCNQAKMTNNGQMPLWRLKTVSQIKVFSLCEYKEQGVL